MASSDEGRRYEQIAGEIDRALHFMAACGIDLISEESLHQVDFFTSHEALILGYEEALTRQDSISGDFYDCSAHMVWVGERTRQSRRRPSRVPLRYRQSRRLQAGSDGHGRRGARPCANDSTPNAIPGRLTLITRMGATRVADALPPLLEAVRDAGHPVVWACDPMHGNTFASDGGRKTRRFDDILQELRGFFDAHHGPAPGPAVCTSS